MDRQAIFDLREDYATGNHPLPEGQRQYAAALRNIQAKARTNYIALVQQAITQKMRKKGFRFGIDSFADQDAQRIWQYNDMDQQAPILIQRAAMFGFMYAVVRPAEEPDGEPIIALRDPRLCEIERDPDRPTKTIAGLEYWIDVVADKAYANLHLPDATYVFEASSTESGFLKQLTRHGITNTINNFDVIDVIPNELGIVPLVRLDWEPSFGEYGRAAGEEAWDIQDRINKTVLHRLVISGSQAFKQRWVKSPATKIKNGRPPWDPGADSLWLTTDPDAEFGEFTAADVAGVLEEVRDDIGDLVAITQTPAAYLVNRMVNVSGDTLLQVNSGHTARVRRHQDVVGFFFEQLVKLAFAYKGDPRSKDVTAQTLWWPVDIRSFAEVADAFQKLVASGIPLQLAMEHTGQFTDEQIRFAVKEAEKAEQKAMAREDQLLDRQEKAQQKQETSSREEPE